MVNDRYMVLTDSEWQEMLSTTDSMLEAHKGVTNMANAGARASSHTAGSAKPHVVIKLTEVMYYEPTVTVKVISKESK